MTLYIAWLFRYSIGVKPVSLLKKREKEEASSKPSFGGQQCGHVGEYPVAHGGQHWKGCGGGHNNMKIFALLK